MRATTARAGRSKRDRPGPEPVRLPRGPVLGAARDAPGASCGPGHASTVNPDDQMRVGSSGERGRPIRAEEAWRRPCCGPPDDQRGPLRSREHTDLRERNERSDRPGHGSVRFADLVATRYPCSYVTDESEEVWQL